MRSLTDYITNHTVLSVGELETVLPRLLDPRQGLQSSILPTFLHEATHHWCFSSPVGTTIALLALRGQLRALQAIEATVASERNALELKAAEDLVRVVVTSELLRPLAEGLATFAEFDVMLNSRAPAIPAPLRWAILACNRSLLERDRKKENWVRYRIDAFQHTSLELALARTTADAVNRRIDILQQPLSCMPLPMDHPSCGKEGYLAGYLTIKNLWRQVERYNEYIQFSDFYLLFLYEYFYEDEGLISVLLDETLIAPQSLGPIFKYVLDRLAPISESVVNDFCARMLDVRRAAYEDDILLFPSHAGDRNPNLRADQLWWRVLGEERPLFPPQDKNTPMSSQFAFLSSSLANGRDLLSIGALSVEAHVGPEQTMITLPRGERVSLSTLPSAPQGTFAAIVTLFLGTRSGRHVVYVTTEQRAGLALQITPEATSQSEWERYLRAALGRDAPEFCGLLMSFQEAKLNELLELTRIDGYVSQTTERLDALYAPLALMTVPEAMRKEAFIKMRQDGIYGLLDERDDLLRAIAIMRQGAGFRYTPVGLRDDFAKANIDLDIVIRDLEAYEEKFKLFGFQSGITISSTL